MEDQINNYSKLLSAAKACIPELEGRWYPYGSLNNFILLDAVVPDGWLSFQSRLCGSRIADIGVADGETSFFLEQSGVEVDVIENRATNYNGLEGLKALHRFLNSRIRLFEVDLDEHFVLDNDYEFVMLLGVLYHLKNPFYVLEHLAKKSKRMVLSTRIFTHNVIGGMDLAGVPCAYLLDPDECNNDATNFWIFTQVGLGRLLTRTGWQVKGWKNYGATPSDPFSQARDERAFVYLESRVSI